MKTNTHLILCFADTIVVIVSGLLLLSAGLVSAHADEPDGFGGIYVVREGDILSRIAEKKSISLTALIKANPQIQNPNRILVGQKLNLPPDPFQVVKKAKSDSKIVEVLSKNAAFFDANQRRHGNPLLCHALENGCGLAVIKVLVNHGANVNATNREGRTVLMVALKEGCESNIVSLLVRSGADCNAREPKTDKTPLMFAIDNNADRNTIGALCNLGRANVLALDAEGNDFYTYRSRWHESRQKAELDFLFKKREEAIAAQDSTMLSISLQTDPNKVSDRVRLESDWRATDSKGRSLLMLMAANNHNPEVIELALQNGGSVLQRDKRGWKAADFAVAKNSELTVVQRLVVEEMLLLDTEKGSKEYQKRIDKLRTKVSGGDGSVSGPRRDRNKAAIAIYALSVVTGYWPYLSAALASGSAVLAFTDAHVERIDELLAVAASNTKNPAVLDFLLAQNAKINVADDFGITPLMCAVANNPDSKIAIHLIEKGADPTAVTVKELETKDRSSYLRWTFFENTGTADGFRIPEEKILKQTPVCLLACMADAPLATLNALIDKGADTKAHDVEGTTCLMLACKHSRNPELVLRLLNHDLSSPELKSKNGKGPKAWSFWRENNWLKNDKRIEKQFSEFQNYK